MTLIVYPISYLDTNIYKNIINNLETKNLLKFFGIIKLGKNLNFFYQSYNGFREIKSCNNDKQKNFYFVFGIDLNLAKNICNMLNLDLETLFKFI